MAYGCLSKNKIKIQWPIAAIVSHDTLRCDVVVPVWSFVELTMATGWKDSRIAGTDFDSGYALEYKNPFSKWWQVKS